MKKATIYKFLDKVKNDKGRFLLRFLHVIKASSNSVYHSTLDEAVELDGSWVDVLDNAMFSIENIVNNPRRFIAEEDIIVDVSRAKRTTAKTVRHLSSNSQYVQNISADGEITPKKLLTSELNEDLAIYENRFVASLVHFAVGFVEKRYQDISAHSDSFTNTSAGITSHFVFGRNECDVKIDVNVKGEAKDKTLLQKNEELLEKILNVRKRLKSMLTTNFMRTLDQAKPVRPPIVRTNLLKMNVDYNNAYKLWVFLSSYTQSGYSVEVSSKNLPVSKSFYDDLSSVVAMSLQTVLLNRYLNQEEFDNVPDKERRERKFRIDKRYRFLTPFKKDSHGPGEDVINEYFYKKMKGELKEKARVPGVNKAVNEKDIKQSFSRLFKNVAKISDQVLFDVINEQTQNVNITDLTTLKKKELAVKRQKEYLSRYRQFSLLKRQDLEKALRAETREVLKLEKLEAELAKEKGKEKRRKEREKLKRKKLKAIRDKKKIAKKNVSEYEKGLREEIAAKEAQKAAERAARREEAKRRRELKMLAALKDKYDGESEN